MMTKTTKSERKYGKKEDSPDTVKRRSKGKPKEGKPIDEPLYKILVDGSGFTKSMTYDDCQKEIEIYESRAKRLNRGLPSLILVKQ